jgi:putative tricarboxylic transport membrane protein
MKVKAEAGRQEAERSGLHLVLLLSAFVFGCALAAAGASAQTFPAKPIELVVHTSAGGGGDLFARAVADIIARGKLLPQPLVIANRGGGGGAIAFNYVAGRRGDPYTLLAVPSTVFLTAALRSGLDIGLDRFTPLAAFGLDLNALTVRADSPYRTAADLVEAARREPDSIVIAYGSVGGTAHYLAWQIGKATGARFRTVSMKGAQAVMSLLGGHVHATTENLSEVMGHVEGGKLRVLGVPAAQRPAVAPGVPTLREQGFDIRSGVMRGFAAAADIPGEAVAVLEAVLRKAHQSPEWAEHARRNLIESAFLDAAAWRGYLAERQPEMAQFMKDVGLVRKP